MPNELEKKETALLIKALDGKLFNKPDDLPDFTERQVLLELKMRDLTRLSEEEKFIVSFADSRNNLFERERDSFKTRKMDAASLLQKLSEFVGNDFYRTKYVRELEIRREEGELSGEQESKFMQLKENILRIRRETVEEIKGIMNTNTATEPFEGSRGKAKLWN